MEVWISVTAVALAFLILAGEPLVEILLFVVDLRDDLRNHNDRGRLKKPSSKYVV